MCFFIIIFLSLVNLMINKYTSYIIVLECWNTADRKHPTERENGPHFKKLLKTTSPHRASVQSNTAVSVSLRRQKTYRQSRKFPHHFSRIDILASAAASMYLDWMQLWRPKFKSAFQESEKSAVFRRAEESTLIRTGLNFCPVSGLLQVNIDWCRAWLGLMGA
jgi:hypothetical protein